MEKKALEAQACDRVCRLCKWFAEETEVCVNDESDHLADFVLPDDVCDKWEGNDAGKKDA